MDDGPHDGEEQWIGRAVRSVIVLAAIGAAGWIWLAPTPAHRVRSDSGEVGPNVSAQLVERTSPSTTTTTTPVTTSTTTALPQLPAGLSCSDLARAGFDYAAAVRYWNGSGQPESMDEDGDGTPCETDYTRAEIQAELGDGTTDTRSTTSATTTTTTTRRGKPAPGISCSQLKARGIDARGAVAYFLDQGSPGRMDADGNGIPCESVYPGIASVWDSRSRR